MCTFIILNSVVDYKVSNGRLRGLAVAGWTTYHYHLCLNPGMGISEGCFITFGGRSAHLAYHVHKSGHKTSIVHHHQMCVKSKEIFLFCI